MSASTRSYSKESSHYSRSSSYHASSNSHNRSSSSNFRQLTDDRPLSSRLIERDFSYPSLSWHWNDPFYFDRIRSRWENDLFKWNYILTRPSPIYYRSWNNSSSSRIIPIEFSLSSSSINRRQALGKQSNNNDELSSNFVNRPDENLMSTNEKQEICLVFISFLFFLGRENRLTANDWPPLQGKTSSSSKKNSFI